MRATQGMDKSIPRKSVKCSQHDRFFCSITLTGCGKNQDYSGVILECLNKECKATCALSGSEALASRNS